MCGFCTCQRGNSFYNESNLDMGPDGIIFPFCNNAEIARTAVRACSYPGDDYHGIRGQGPVRAIHYGLDDEGAYLKEAYAKVLKIVQIETYEGYRNLNEILAVEGIDSLFIGMADMTRSLAGILEGPKPDAVFDEWINPYDGYLNKGLSHQRFKIKGAGSPYFCTVYEDRLPGQHAHPLKKQGHFRQDMGSNDPFGGGLNCNLLFNLRI